MSRSKQFLAVLLLALSSCRSSARGPGDNQLDIPIVIGIVSEGQRASALASAVRIVAPAGTARLQVTQKELVIEYNDIVAAHNRALEVLATLVRDPAPASLDAAEYRSALLRRFGQSASDLVRRVDAFAESVRTNEQVVVARSAATATTANADTEDVMSIDQIVSDARRLGAATIGSSTRADESDAKAREQCAKQLLALRLEPVQSFPSEDSK
ncbi:MAG: hypothetical protein IT453_09955 [Planctomycetes bacterium]|nr:hypothetical protein [Planctomycetota bacterium]